MAESVALKICEAVTPRAGLVLAHGAGAGQASAFMVRVARGFAERHVACATFDFPYITAGRRVPDRTPILEATWAAAIAEARAAFGHLPLFIGGKSMGGRIASHVAAAPTDLRPGSGALAGLIFFGYPLHPPDKPQQRRDAHLPAIAEPMLFIQGSKDPFGTSEEIRALLPSLQHATVHVVEGGDHSLKVSRRDDAIEGVIDAAVEWISDVCRTRE